MAFSAPGTPRTPKAPHFATPKRTQISNRAPTTDNANLTTPSRTPKMVACVPSTPECFNSVTVETPNSAAKKRRSSSTNGKEKFDQVSNLTVAVRIRPMNAKELSCVGSSDVVKVKGKELMIRSTPLGNSAMSLDHVFQYDHIFWSCDETSPLFSSQDDVYVTMGKPLLNYAFRGYNACLFAYGQTGSGKSFSMMGRNTCEIIDIDSEDYSGLTPRFCRDLFDRISELGPESTATVEVSYFEIYNEKIHDLLAFNNGAVNKQPLKVREHPEWGPYVVDLSAHTVKSYDELRTWLIVGNKNRATAATSMNEKSSRSHSIFSIELCLSDGKSAGSADEDNSGRRSKVSLVDLAGSERLGSCHNSEEKIRQGVSINKSLLTLGKVISSLADQKKNQFVPYRESVLTWLLRESLGGNSLTSMLATITPANNNLDETIATLRYACQARSIVNRARINENPHDRLIRELKSEVQRLKALKQDFERNSLSCNNSTCSTLNDSFNGSREELEELRHKLAKAEDVLSSAEKSWQQKLIECTESRLQELAQSEKRREELESKFRVLETVDTNSMDLSVYQTNFLEELEGVLTQDGMDNGGLAIDKISDGDLIESVMDWCFHNGLKCTFSPSVITIVDVINTKQCFLLRKDLFKLMNYENIGDFVNCLTWVDVKQSTTVKSLSKTEIMTYFSQIYSALNNLQPSPDSGNENNVNIFFAKVNRSLQNFEAALLKNLAKNKSQKSVTFNFHTDTK